RKHNPHSHFLPLAVDPSLYAEQIPFDKRDEKYSVSFYGSHYPNRQQFFQHLADLPLTLVGFRWAEKTRDTPLASRVLPLQLNSDRSMTDLAKVCEFFNKTKINLNVHFTHSVNSPNLRTFEIPATKSFQLCNDLPDLHTMFVPDKELVLYKDIADCRKKIKHYLEHPEERKRIAAAGYRRVIAEHTFDHRMKDALRVILQDMKQTSKK
ncbi:MAG: glycosyltransferase, partial [Nanoarchaeota archaeon]